MRGSCVLCLTTSSSRFHDAQIFKSTISELYGKLINYCDQICSSCKAKLHRIKQPLVSKTYLEKLPNNIINAITSRLEIKDIISLRQVNKTMKDKVSNFLNEIHKKDQFLSLKYSYYKQLYMKCNIENLKQEQTITKLSNEIEMMKCIQNNFDVTYLKRKIASLETENTILNERLNDLTHIEQCKPLNKSQESLFRKIIKHKQGQSHSSIIEAKNARGSSKKFSLIVTPRVKVNVVNQH